MTSYVNAFHKKFLSTPSARRATQNAMQRDNVTKISIHALREEGDVWSTNITVKKDISIHALREEGDIERRIRTTTNSLFLSTPSARRATRWAVIEMVASYDFYPRPPRGGRLQTSKPDSMSREISIHALREEGDLITSTSGFSVSLFLSTPSARRATLRLPAP